MGVFREDWLNCVLRVPYVPTLGPVGPQAISPALFEAVAAVAGTGRFLPYDKDRRWFAVKREHVLAGKVVCEPGRTVIPVLSARSPLALTVFAYTLGGPGLAELETRGRDWRAETGAATARVVWFQLVPDGALTRLLLKAYTAGDLGAGAGGVADLTRTPEAASWEEFVRDAGEPGFAFLARRMREGLADGPVLVAVDGGRIVGAAGPLSVTDDPVGERTVPPQYFGVLPGYRGRGHGRALWRTSAAWAYANGARYKVLQAQCGSAAERLYLSEGLATLGFTRASPVAVT